MRQDRFISCPSHSSRTGNLDRHHDEDSSIQISDDNNGIRHLDELAHVLQKYGIDSNDIIIVGSAAFTGIGCRPNNDLEFCCNRRAYRKIPLKIRFELLFHTHYAVSPNVDLFRNMYAVVGLLDGEIWKKGYYEEKNKYKTADINIEYCYKSKLGREKDRNDLAAIEDSPELKVKFDRNRINEIIEKSDKYTAYVKLRAFAARVLSRIRRKR